MRFMILTMAVALIGAGCQDVDNPGVASATVTASTTGVGGGSTSSATSGAGGTAGAWNTGGGSGGMGAGSSACSLTIEYLPPAMSQYVSGTTEADMGRFIFTAAAECPAPPVPVVYMTDLTVQVYIDCDTTGDFSNTGTATVPENCADDATGLQDIFTALDLYDKFGSAVGLSEITPDGKLVLDELTHSLFAKNPTVLSLRGNISSSAPKGTLADRVKFGIVEIVVRDALWNLLTGSQVNVSGATNGGPSDSGIIVTIMPATP